SGLVVMNEAFLNQPVRNSHPCIKCGECVRACPMHLNPKELGLLAAKREYALMAERFNLNDCFECGCCSFVCPSAIPLVQYFRVAKAYNRENAA
ncbi:MAG: 4Fe-4S dicluster domain-containing protein, partial [Pseudomonadota bacterium]